MNIVLYIILTLSTLLGIITGLSYLSHPLAGSSYISYAGRHWWIISFIIVIVLFLKG